MRLLNDKVILRDMTEADINDHILWRTEKTEWMNWDAPWRMRDTDSSRLRKRLEDKLFNLRSDGIRMTFEICINDEACTHIGWLNTYGIDHGLAIGIDLPDSNIRGKGYGTAALCLYIDYLFENDYDELYLQTWSGNERMIHIARKLGFNECDRQINARAVNGSYYDALTFCLKHNK